MKASSFGKWYLNIYTKNYTNFGIIYIKSEKRNITEKLF